MKIKIKKLHPQAVIPKYAKEGDAGLDLTAVSRAYDNNGNVVYGTGLAVEIPEGHVGLMFPRSSVSGRSIVMANSVGVIDSGYRGEIMVKFKPTLVFDSKVNCCQPFAHEYREGERVAQLIVIPFPSVEFEECEELSDSERGTGGYGSSGC